MESYIYLTGKLLYQRFKLRKEKKDKNRPTIITSEMLSGINTHPDFLNKSPSFLEKKW